MSRVDFSKILVAPSILAADFSRLAAECESVEKAGADWLHMDVMDGHFVDNISFGPAVCDAVKRVTGLPLDVHLMISRPDHYLDRFIPCAFNITIHLESDANDISATLRRIRAARRLAGLSIRPGTPVEALEPFLEQVDLVLVMTVEPGFGGQAFMPEMVAKLERLDALRAERNLAFHIQVDGGINAPQAKTCVEAGANVLVAGTSVFGQSDRAAAIRALRGGLLAYRVS